MVSSRDYGPTSTDACAPLYTGACQDCGHAAARTRLPLGLDASFAEDALQVCGVPSAVQVPLGVENCTSGPGKHCERVQMEVALDDDAGGPTGSEASDDEIRRYDQKRTALEGAILAGTREAQRGVGFPAWKSIQLVPRNKQSANPPWSVSC